MTNPIVERLLRLMDYRSGEIRAGAAAEIRKIFSTKDAEIERLSAELERARAERDRLQQTVEFVVRWAWRSDPPNANNKMSDSERLSVIKFYPPIKNAAQPHIELADKEARKFLEETDDRT